MKANRYRVIGQGKFTESTLDPEGLFLFADEAEKEIAALEAENTDLKDRLKTLDEDDYIAIRALAQKAEEKTSALEANNARLKKIIDIENLRAEVAEEKAAQLEADLKLNAHMLARQCDLAREAETKAARLEKRVEALKDALMKLRIWTQRDCYEGLSEETEMQLAEENLRADAALLASAPAENGEDQTENKAPSSAGLRDRSENGLRAPVQRTDHFPAPQPDQREMKIRRDPNGAIDEIVANGCICIEQMDDGEWWIEIEREDGKQRYVLALQSRGKITATVTEGLQSPDAQSTEVNTQYKVDMRGVRGPVRPEPRGIKS